MAAATSGVSISQRGAGTGSSFPRSSTCGARPAWCRIAGAVIALAFVAGAALSAGPAGVALLWLTVVTCFAWLLTAPGWLYRIVPHPDGPARAGR